MHVTQHSPSLIEGTRKIPLNQESYLVKKQLSKLSYLGEFWKKNPLKQESPAPSFDKYSKFYPTVQAGTVDWQAATA